ncbi:hypothetical protein F3087_26985 [Nocardia colli]|uniref:Uncharacterized protein n=1 Tax=Nocardia colli TaxID=2545717 RepID=A0A5N0EBA7_9NOCA|nr:hypothetical protein [Nocardia colli]KAA8886233.1 hypothetical protein F3087_26985 [Nocardia colli]
MITGISLSGIDATLVLLQYTTDGYRPLTLGIAGTYNRLGCVDGVRGDLNTELVLRYFVDQRRAGRYFAEDQTGIADEDRLTSDSDIEELLQRIERTQRSNDDGKYSGSTSSDREAIVFALIAQPIWDAITNGTPAPDGLSERELQRLFGQVSAPAEIYAGRLPELAPLLHQLAAVDDFIGSRRLRWAPPSEPAQRYPSDYGQHGDEIREFLDRAKRDYRDDPIVLAGLATYESQIDWDEDDYPATPHIPAATAAEIRAWAMSERVARRAIGIRRDETEQS